MRSAGLIRFFIIAILVVIVLVDTIIIHNLQKKIDRISIISFEDSSLVQYSARSVSKPTILLTADFVDQFSKYSSPFKDGLSFRELVKTKIKNRWADHYGTPRGSSSCRRIHEGIDLFVPENTPLYPLADFGLVTEVSDNPHYLVKAECTKKNGEIDTVNVEYGKTVRILYPEGIESVYTHLNEVFVQLGDQVDRTTKVGLTGRTGNIRNSGKASHLHLELRDSQNKSFDPRHRLYFEQANLKNFLKHFKIGEN